MFDLLLCNMNLLTFGAASEAALRNSLNQGLEMTDSFKTSQEINEKMFIYWKVYSAFRKCGKKSPIQFTVIQNNDVHLYKADQQAWHRSHLEHEYIEERYQPGSCRWTEAVTTAKQSLLPSFSVCWRKAANNILMVQRIGVQAVYLIKGRSSWYTHTSVLLPVPFRSFISSILVFWSRVVTCFPDAVSALAPKVRFLRSEQKHYF